MKLQAGRFEDLTASNLARACGSKNPAGKYVNIGFGFYTTNDKFFVTMNYNKRLGVFTVRLLFNFAQYVSEYKTIAQACFFTFKEAYQWAENELCMWQKEQGETYGRAKWQEDIFKAKTEYFAARLSESYLSKWSELNRPQLKQ